MIPPITTKVNHERAAEGEDGDDRLPAATTPAAVVHAQPARWASAHGDPDNDRLKELQRSSADSFADQEDAEGGEGDGGADLDCLFG